MKNANAIFNVADQLSHVCNEINTLVTRVKDAEAFDFNAEVFENMLLDEVQNAQILTIEMTKLVSNEYATDGDGSAFSEGELTSVKNAEKEKGDAV